MKALIQNLNFQHETESVRKFLLENGDLLSGFRSVEYDHFCSTHRILIWPHEVGKGVKEFCRAVRDRFTCEWTKEILTHHTSYDAVLKINPDGGTIKICIFDAEPRSEKKPDLVEL